MITPYAFDDSEGFYKTYYENQVGGGLSVFNGATTQRGHGIGGLFSGLIKGAMPLLKSGAKTIGKSLLRAGVDVTKDALRGQDFKTSLKKNFSSAGESLLQTLSDKMSETDSRPIKRKKLSKHYNANSKRRRTQKKPGSLFQRVKVSTS